MDELAAQQRLVLPELDEPAYFTGALPDEATTEMTTTRTTTSPPSSPSNGGVRRAWVVGAAGGLAAAGLMLTAGAVVARHLPANSSVAAAAKPTQQLWGWGGGDGPSLFCWAIMRTSSYERDILEAQYSNGAGIFECDDQAVFSEEPVLLGGEFQTDGIGALSSQLGGEGPLATGSWVNTENFFRAWARLRESGRFSGYDWVIKVDPDTVLFPNVLKQHLLQRGMGGEVNLYLSNCPNVDNGFYGCVEATSQSAFASFMDSLDDCRQTLPFSGWGEDLFAQKCMDSVGVGNVGDFDLVMDGNCHGPGSPPPCNPGLPAYHPFKSPDAWLQCWHQAGGGGGGGFVEQQGGFLAQGGGRPFPRGQPFPGAEPEFMDEQEADQQEFLMEEQGGDAFRGQRHHFPTELLNPAEDGEGGGGGGSWWAFKLPSYHRRL